MVKGAGRVISNMEAVIIPVINTAATATNRGQSSSTFLRFFYCTKQTYIFWIIRFVFNNRVVQFSPVNIDKCYSCNIIVV